VHGNTGCGKQDEEEGENAPDDIDPRSRNNVLLRP
jgi:hypothetical protein